MTKLTKKDFQNFQSTVLEWNTIAGNLPEDQSLREAQIDFCKEEIAEGVKAGKEKDLVGMLDAIVDNIYTGFFLANIVHKGYGHDWWNYIVGLKGSDISARDLQNHLTNGHISDYTRDLTEWVKVNEDKFDIGGAFNLITESNFSKFCKVGEVSVEEEISSIESEGRYGEVFAETVGDYIVFRAKKDLREDKTFEKGKIVKPSTFKSPEDLGGLGQFVY